MRRILIAVATFAATLGGLLLFARSSPEILPDGTIKRHFLEAKMVRLCHDRVRESAGDYRSVDFVDSDMRISNARDGDGKLVIGSVRGSNGFGATVKNGYACTITMVQGKYPHVISASVY